MEISYRPINYLEWDLSGKGRNILNLLAEKEKIIWDLSLPYQDKRDDKGHAEVVTYFSLNLLGILGGERKIIIPSAILHDTGWSQMDYSVDKLSDKESRIMHEKLGAEFAEKLLLKEKYESNLINKIYGIINGHDTRKEFLSLEDGIVRDADKLWRFSAMNIRLDMSRHNREFNEQADRLREKLEEKGFFYSDDSNKIAETELNNSIHQYVSVEEIRRRIDSVYKF